MDDHQLIETLRSEIDRLRIEVEALRLMLQSQPIRFVPYEPYTPPIYPTYPPYPFWYYTVCGGDTLTEVTM